MAKKVGKATITKGSGKPMVSGTRKNPRPTSKKHGYPC
jgi:hypothetical protein